MKLFNGKNIVRCEYNQKNKMNHKKRLTKILCFVVSAVLAGITATADLDMRTVKAGDDYGISGLDTIARTPEGAPMDDFLVSASLTHDGTNVEDGDKIIVGEEYAFHAKFEESGEHQFSSPMYYQMPDGLTCQAMEKDIIKDGKKVGHYTIAEDGLLTVVWTDEEYIKNHGDVWLEFEFYLRAEKTNADGKVEIPWAGEGTHSFVADLDSEVKLDKTNGNYNATSHTVSYEVELKVTKGMVTDPQLKDVLGEHLTYTGGGSIRILDENNNDITPQPAPEIVPDYENGKAIGWHIKGLQGPLYKGQKVIVEYDAQIDESSFNGDEESNSFNFEAKNKAVFDGKKPAGGGDIHKEKDVTFSITNEMLHKTGSQVAGQNQIDWEIEVGKTGAADVRGVMVTDTLGSGQTVNKNEKLEFKWKDQNNKTLKTLPLEWSDDPNAPIWKYVDRKEYENTGVLKFTIPDAADDFWKNGVEGDEGREWTDGDWVKIEFYSNTDGGGTFNNKAETTIDGIPFEDEKKVIVGTGAINKTLLEDDGEYLKYKVSIAVPQLKSPSSSDRFKDSKSKKYPYFYVVDQLAFEDVIVYGDNGTVLRTDRYFVNNQPDIESIIVTDENGKKYRLENIASILSHEGLYDPAGNPEGVHTFQIVRPDSTTNEDGEKVWREFQIWFDTHLYEAKEKKYPYHGSVWTFFESSVNLEITYRINYNEKLLLESPSGSKSYSKTEFTMGDLLKQQHELKNEVWGKDDDGGSNNDVDTYTKYSKEPTIVKNGEIGEGNIIDYTVRFDGYSVDATTGDVKKIEIDPDKFALEDVFDSRLEYVPGSLQVEVYKIVEDEGYYATYKYAGNPVSSDGRIYATASGFSEKIGEKGYQPSLYKFMSTARRAYYIFSYQLRPKDRFVDGQELEVTNNATVHFGDKTVTDDATVTFTPQILDKVAVQEFNGDKGTSLLHYSIDVNPGASDLVKGVYEGQSYDGESYELLDTMDENLHLEWNTVKVEYEKGKDENGNPIWEPLSRIYDRYGVTHGKEGNKSYFLDVLEDGSNGMLLVVPDELHIKVSYDALFDAKLGETVEVKNTVTLRGDIQLQDTEDRSFSMQESGATTGAGEAVRLTKIDSDTKNPVDGSEFVLYYEGATGSGGEVVSVEDNTSEHHTLKLDGKGAYKPVAKENGVLINKVENYEGYYVLIETKAAEGYIKNPQPIVFKCDEPPVAGAETVTVTVGDQNYTVQVQYFNDVHNAYSFPNTRDEYRLPETGGQGYAYLYLLGGIFTVLGVVFLLNKKRVYAKRS